MGSKEERKRQARPEWPVCPLAPSPPYPGRTHNIYVGLYHLYLQANDWTRVCVSSCVSSCMRWWSMPSKHAKTAQRRRQRKAAAKTNTVHPHGDDGARQKRHPASRARNGRAHAVPVDPPPPATADAAPSSLRVEPPRGPSANAPDPPAPPNRRAHPRCRNDASGSRPDSACVDAKRRARRGAYDQGADWRRARRDARDRKSGPLEAELQVDDGGW